MVVVYAESESDLFDTILAFRRDDDRPVRALHGMDPLEPLADADRRAVRAVGDDPCRVARVPPGEAE